MITGVCNALICPVYCCALSLIDIGTHMVEIHYIQTMCVCLSCVCVCMCVVYWTMYSSVLQLCSVRQCVVPNVLVHEYKH